MNQQVRDQDLCDLVSRLTSEQTEYIGRALAIVDEGSKRGIPLRLLGSTAVLLTCPNHLALFETMSRPLTDIDLIAYYSDQAAVGRLMNELGFEMRGGRGVTMDVFTGRQIFVAREAENLHVDIFYDKLDFCHAIDFRRRLDLGGAYTIPLSDLFLEKMQIVEINEKDLKDTIILLLEHELTQDEPSGVNLRRITGLLGEDWGFYYTVTTNLGKVGRYADGLAILTDEEKRRVRSQVDALLRAIEHAPRSIQWKLRSKVGTKKRWYNEVGEGYREIGEPRG